MSNLTQWLDLAHSCCANTSCDPCAGQECIGPPGSECSVCPEPVESADSCTRCNTLVTIRGMKALGECAIEYETLVEDLVELLPEQHRLSP